MRQDPIPVVVSFPLTERTRATIEGASPLVHILEYPTEQLRQGTPRPPPTNAQALALSKAEVLFGSHLDPISLHDAAPNLKWFQVLTAGLDELIEQGILERDFTITTMSGIGAVAIAEYCMGVMVMLEKGLHSTMRQQVKHNWDFRFTGQLHGKTCGIVGLGAIGRELAQRARAFGMRTIATRRSVQPGDSSPDVDVLLPSSELAQLLRESDYVNLCIPLTNETVGMIGEEEIAMMKPEAAIVNIARAAVVDTAALLEALRNGRIAGAAIDVFDPEPLPEDSPFWDLSNVIVTPHRSGALEGYFDRAAEFFAENLGRYARGEPLSNMVRRERGY
ncbi:MAG: hydroxyacid dehydrogenase [Dehalococcoidia bacterium]|nr:hydroxyacid dehydrogenase [Dehalococcoidia bacterium]|tara:strand:- start:7645 stop:8646 length:1002 start_codon:yes stop_codon:yes gene_type:complete